MNLLLVLHNLFLNENVFQENYICQLLNEKPKYSKVKDMPSATLLETIKHHIIDLKNIQVLYIIIIIFFSIIIQIQIKLLSTLYLD